jgi:hypothetical protein
MILPLRSIGWRGEGRGEVRFGAVISEYLCHIERRCVSIAFFKFISMEERCEWKRRPGQAVAPSSFLTSTAATDGVANFVGKRPCLGKNQAGLEDRPEQ